MVDYKVEPNIDKMNLLHWVIELIPLQHLQGISVYVQNFVCLNFRMPALNKRPYNSR